MDCFDTLIVGAGAAGLHCAAMAGQLGVRVAVVDHSPKIAEKIRISGGGRCNFTNRDATPAQFLSENPHFCRSALARYTPQDFVALLQRHGIAFHEKHRGQLFCDGPSEQVITMLLRECDAGGVVRRHGCVPQAVTHGIDGFRVDTDAGSMTARRLVVATGGLSIPQIGASDWGLRLARQFGHRVVETRPALVPLTFEAASWAPMTALAGVSLPVQVQTIGRRKQAFTEDLLFTHRGLSGPAALQISTYWQPGESIRIDLAPDTDAAQHLLQAKLTSKRKLANELAAWWPRRLCEAWVEHQLPAGSGERPLADWRDLDLAAVAAGLKRWEVAPGGTEGYRKAEVMVGGVDTRELASSSLESRRVPGLHFIGEVVDVTGWLGGYNFQWAWSSAAACARAIAGSHSGETALRKT